MWLVACAGAIAFPGIAFGVGISAGKNGAASAIIAATFARFGTRLAHAIADVVAADAVDAKVGQTLRFVSARHAIVCFANANAIACAAPAFLIGVAVITNGATCAVDPLVFLRYGASLTGAQAPAITTHAVGTIPRRTLGRRCTSRTVGERGLRVRRACPRAIAIAAGAFIVGIGSGFDCATNTVLPTALFRCTTSLAAAHADVATTNAIDAIIRQTLRVGGASNTVVILAHVFPIARTVRTIIVRVGVIRDGSTNAIGPASLFRCAAGHAFVIAFLVAAKTVNAITRRALRTRRARRSRRGWSNYREFID